MEYWIFVEPLEVNVNDWSLRAVLPKVKAGTDKVLEAVPSLYRIDACTVPDVPAVVMICSILTRYVPAGQVDDPQEIFVAATDAVKPVEYTLP